MVLSYLHTFHAGNKADVCKHSALDAALRALRLQPRPLHYLDTHAGRGIYDLTSAEARKTSEADDGILGLLASKKRPPALAPYLDLVRRFNTPARIKTYPGSPAIAAARLRATDRLTLCEKHPREIVALRENFSDDPRTTIKNEDGWSVLQSGLRANSDRRLFVLIDPSYETAKDYDDAINCVSALKRAPRQSILFIWTPILPDDRQEPLLSAAVQAGGRISRIEWGPPQSGRTGLIGTAIAIFGADQRLIRSVNDTLVAAASLLGATHELVQKASPDAPSRLNTE